MVAAEAGREDTRAVSGMVRHAMRMMVGTLASRVLGLLREVLTAAVFGATRSLDAFYVSYTLANLARQLLAEGALSASFVPVFSRVLKRDGFEASRALARQVMTILLAAVFAVVAIGVAGSPILVDVIAPGFGAGERALAISLTRALFPFLILVSVGALAMGVLNSLGSFFVPAVAPAASNVAYIAVLLALMHYGSVWILVAAVLVGGACSMALQWSWSAKLGVTLSPVLPDRGNADLRETLKLFLPYAAGLSLNQVNPIISRMLGSFLEDGVISVLTYADRVIQLPLGLFVIAISQAVLPMLSRIEADDTDEFAVFIRDALRFNLFIVMPLAIALVCTSSAVTHLIFVRGAFGEWAWHATSGALMCYGIGLPGIACNTVLMRALYARRMPRGAVTVTLFTVAANLALGLLLMRFFSYRGLAVATSLAFTGAAFVGGALLRRELGVPIGVFGVKWLAKLAGSCAALAASLYAFSVLIPYPPEMPIIYRVAWFFGAAAICAAAYAGCTLAMRSPEWAWIGEALRVRRSSVRGGE